VTAGASDGRPEASAVVRLPARPRVEHRGVGVDEGALVALASAGGGRRLREGESPPARTARPPFALLPFVALAALCAFVVERARANRRAA
jgi:hypothetical protein